MFTKLRRALKLRSAWRAITKAFNKESKMGKKWYESTQFWGVCIKTGAGLLTTFGLLKHQIDDAQLAQFAEHIPTFITGVFTVFGTIMETWGKRKHAEAVAVAASK